MAASSCPERTYWYKCNRLLIEGGRAVLKEFLKKSCHGTLDNFLALNKFQLEKLYKRKILKQCQWNKLFPQSDIESMDITLLSCIISNCIIQPSSPERTALDSIRNLRNDVYGHVCNLMMGECEFKNKWKLINDALSNAIVVFGINISLKNYIDAIEKEEVVDKEEIEHVKHELETWKHNDDALCLEISELKGEVKANSSGISELKGEVKENSLGISKLQDKVKEMDAEIRQKRNFSSQDSNDEESSSPKKKSRQMNVSVKQEVISPALVKQDLPELQTCLVKYYEKYLLKSPVTATASSNSETAIDEIYAEPELEVVDHTALRKLASDNPTSDNKELICVKDIFFKDGKKCHNIYISGDAGMGKTSLCKRILSSWCKAWQTDNPSDELEMALRQYDFLFYISMRNANGQYDIQNMIVSQLLNYILSNNKTLRCVQPEFLLRELLEQFSEKCLIILDGLDEWTTQEKSSMPSISNGVPGRNPALNYTIMTTTRPWKLEELRLMGSEISRQIQITGMKDSRQFGEKLTSHFNILNNTNRTYEDFKQCLQNAKLTELCKIPILLKHMICLWFYNQGFGKTKTEVYTNIIELLLLNAEKREDVRHSNPSAFIEFDNNIATPGVFKGKNKCKRYKALLKSVGKLAFETTTHEDGVQLTFDSPEDHGVTEDQMGICLTVGILSKSILPDMVCEKKSISFPHKTFHEYFAALYMGWHDNIPDDIILRNSEEKVLVFLSGIWPSVSEKMLKKYQAGIFGKDYVPENDSFRECHYQKFVMDCCNESVNQNKVCLKVKLRCIVFPKNPYLMLNWNPPGSMICWQNFFSLMSQMNQQKILHTNGDNIMLDFSELCDLVYLQLSEIDLNSLRVNPTLIRLCLNKIKICTPDGMIALMSSIAKAESLKYLTCCSIKCTNAQFTLGNDKRSSRMINIKREDASKEEYFLPMDLSKLTQLSQILLRNLLVSELKLSPVIKKLTLQDITITKHGGIVSLMASVSRMETLEKISMQNIHCEEQSSNRDHSPTIDLSKLTMLRKIDLRNMCISELSLSPVIVKLTLQDIKIAQHCEIVSQMVSVLRMETLEKMQINYINFTSQANNEDCLLKRDLFQLGTIGVIEMYVGLETDSRSLTLRNIKSAHHAIVSLMECVSSMKTLFEINMNDIHCTEHASTEDCVMDIDISKLSKLRRIKIKNICISELSLNPSIYRLTLQDIKIAQHDGIVSLMESVSRMETLEIISMNNIQCAEQSSNGDYGLNIDLSKLIMLRNIDLRNICISELSLNPVIKKLTLQDIKIAQHGGIVSLMASVSRMETLEIISMNNIQCAEQSGNGDHGLNIDLSKIIMLRNIDLRNICISELSLSRVIVELTLKDIKISQHCGIVSQMGSVLSMETLTKMKINNIDFTTQASNEDCFLNRDLFQLETIDFRNKYVPHKIVKDDFTLTLRNIKSAHDGIVSLMESVSSMKRLHEINMNNIHCREHASTEDCVMDIDLSQLTNLRTIELKNICISELSLNLVTQNLTLQDIKIAHHDGIVSLMKHVSSMKTLNAINMNNIHCTEHASTEDCVMDVDLSKISTFRKIELNKICISELSLNPVTQKLTLQDIKIAQHDGIVSLMKHVSSMKTLFAININNIHCTEHASTEDCVMDVDLSKLSTLRNIELKNICIRELSLNPVIFTLTIQDIKIAQHDGIVSLMKHVSSLEALFEINMNNIHCTEHASTEHCVMDIDLSKFPYLRPIELKNICISELSLNTSINRLTLQDIKIAQHDGIVSLMKHVSSMKTLDAINMNIIHCTEHASTEDCVMDIDLSKHSKLRTIELKNICISELSLYPVIGKLTLQDIKIAQHDGIVSLMKHVSSMETLFAINLNNIHCTEHASTEQCVMDVDLSKLLTLRKIELKNICISELSLNPSINRLTLQDIKIAQHDGIVSLMKHVLSMERLDAINLNNIHCTEHESTEDCVMDIDLSKILKLRKIELKNICINELSLNPVIMKLTLQDIKIAHHGGIVSLMESVSCMDNLKIISINNIQCLEHSSNRECFLNIDLSKLDRLTTITLANLTIRELHGSPSFNTIVVNGITIANHDVLLSLKRSDIKCNSLNTVHCAEHGSDACFQPELSDCSCSDEDLADDVLYGWFDDFTTIFAIL